MSTILVIDTASAELALALAQDGVVVHSLVRDAGQDHSRLLLPAIDELLDGDRSRLAGVAVVRGPGSYAGLRVGIATGEGLALALGIPIQGVATLEAVAAASGLEEVTAIHPAGRGEFAAQEFRAGRPAGDMFAAAPEDLAGRQVAGERAASLEGREVTAEERCRAALALILPAFAAEAGAGDVEALYLREPSISRPRRAIAAPQR